MPLLEPSKSQKVSSPNICDSPTWLGAKGRCYQYPSFCTHYCEWAQKLQLSMRQVHLAGEKLFADYAGQTIRGDAYVAERSNIAVSVTFLCPKELSWIRYSTHVRCSKP
jgi:hypothetical protein